MTNDDCEFMEKISDIIDRDDPTDLVKLYHEYPDNVKSVGVALCAIWKAKKCLTALVSGEVCKLKPSPALVSKGYPTYIHTIAWNFPDPDVITTMLSRGAIMDLNIKCHVYTSYGTPLHLSLYALSSELHMHMHLHSWSPADSVFKLIILLCQWETKYRLNAARKFVPNTDSVISLDWTYLRDGKLMQLTALLLVTRKEVMVPSKTGTTIQQGAMDLCNILSSEAGVDHQHKSILTDACKLFDIFERAGDALSLYIRSMNKHIPVDKVLVDVVGILKKAGFSLQFTDVDL